jgi:phosphoserine aminotransferase
MPEIPKIAIPADLLPHDGRFGSGPSRVDTSFVHDLARTGAAFLGTSHRQPAVKNVIHSVQDGIREMYSLPGDYEVVLGVGGATAFWDAAAFGLIERRSAHFVCGEFSSKFASSVAAAPHLGDPVIVAADFGDAPTPVAVSDVDTVAFIHNETSTGVMAPFARLGEGLVAVDGTSSAGAVPFDIEAVDTYYFSPQKALGSEGGLWIALMSPAAIERIETIASTSRWIPEFLSLSTALANSRKFQTYNTPALTTLYLLTRQIDMVNSRGGITWAHATVQETSAHLYRWSEQSPFAEPFVSNIDLRSPTVVTIDLDISVPAATVSSILRTNGIVDTESYRKLGRNQLRIATFPNVTLDDVHALTACVDYIVGHL